MAFRPWKEKGYKHYARDVGQIIAVETSRSIQSAVVEVFDKNVATGRLSESERDRFIEGVRKAYRSLKNRQRPDGSMENHGNSLLTRDEEQILLGFIQGRTRGGDTVTPLLIRQTASAAFPDNGSFSEIWYSLARLNIRTGREF
jgi:hypothetical protein